MPLQNTPVLLGIEGRSIIRLPQGIKRIEEKQIRGKLGADRRNGRLLRLGRRNRLVVAIALVRPPRLGNHDVLPATRLLDAGDLALDKLAGIGGLGVGIEPGVDVDHDDVRGVADARVVDNSRDGLDGADGAVVARLAEGGAGLLDGALGVAGGHGFGVDALVLDTNEAKDVPVAAVVLLHGAGHGAHNVAYALSEKKG